MDKPKDGILLVANWDSDTGYAWWLMESFWAAIASEFSSQYTVYLSYPSISKIPDAIRNSPIHVVERSMFDMGLENLNERLSFLKEKRIKTLYFSDRPARHWNYIIYRLAGVKRIIVHDHTPGLRTKSTGLKKWLKRGLNFIPGYSADALIAVTEFVKKRHLEVNCMPDSRCFVAQNGIPPIDPAVKHAYLKSEFNIQTDQQVMVTTSRANSYKGIQLAIEAMNILVHQKGIHRLHYLFCGDGPALDEFTDLVKAYRLEKHITLAGRRNDIASILPACNFAIHPSKGEVGYSLSILEYMQAGLPVIVPDNESVAGATTDKVTGLLYEEDNIQDMVLKINQMISDVENTTKMGARAQQAVREEFNLANTHRGLLDAFHQTLRTS